EEARRAACRAFNRYAADHFGPFSDRMTPAATIPMHTPQEAIDELEYAVKTLGFKVIVMASMVRRPIPAFEGSTPDVGRLAVWAESTVPMTTIRFGRSA